MAQSVVAGGPQRWLSQQLWKCGGCAAVAKHIDGYTPILNPYHFDHKAQDTAFLAERGRLAGHRGSFMKRCETCNKVHNNWSQIDFQTQLEARAAANHAAQQGDAVASKASEQ
jgi:hypothetical protein